MTKSHLKPSKEELHNALTQYWDAYPHSVVGVEKMALTEFCISIESLVRKVTKIALNEVPPALKSIFIVHFSAVQTLSPIATAVDGNAAFRIAMPIHLIHRLISIAPTRNGCACSVTADYYRSSILIAALAAFAHELNHVFVGHLATPESVAQETHADYMGGALTWSWLRRADIQKLVGISSTNVEANCAFGFLHLVSVFRDQSPENALYLPRIARLLVYAGGAAFAADNKVGAGQGDALELAMCELPMSPSCDFSSTHIKNEYCEMKVQLTEGVKLKVAAALRDIKKEKREWYAKSQHLKPIKKQLNHIVKTNSKNSS